MDRKQGFLSFDKKTKYWMTYPVAFLPGIKLLDPAGPVEDCYKNNDCRLEHGYTAAVHGWDDFLQEVSSGLDQKAQEE